MHHRNNSMPQSSQKTEIPLYPISTAAGLLGISVHTLRMYERCGLFIPYRKKSGHRLYSDSDIERLHCMRRSINEEKISIEGIRRVLSLVPCWAVVRCPPEDREVCPAYLGHSEPCWSLRSKASFCTDRECRSCEVYRDFGDCKSIKGTLRKLLSE